MTISTVNAIPQMTSNNTPSGIAFSGFQSSSNSYFPFDNSLTTGLQLTNANSGGNFHYGYKFENPIKIGRYSISLYNNLNNAPNSWNFEGSNNGSDWDILHQVSNQTSWISNEARTFDTDVTDSYSYYRVNVTRLNGATLYIHDLKMFEVLTLNKTLILHNGEYKNFSGEIEGTPDGIVDLVPKLNSNSGVGGISVSASSETVGQAWLSFDDVNLEAASNPTPGWATFYLPQWIKVSFNEVKIVGKYSLASFGISLSRNTEPMPKDWTFEGSNDDLTWDILDTRVNNVGWNYLEKREYSFSNSNSYKYYRINITASNGFDGVGIGEIELFEAGTPKSPSSWQIVSSTLPTSTQFIEEGMDSLTPILDRAVQNLNPQEMTLDSTFVGEGKLFRKSVDLNKYFDLRTITTETRNS